MHSIWLHVTFTLTISVQQAGIPASRSVMLQYDWPEFWHWLRSPFKSLLLKVIHYFEPLVMCGCYGE